MRKNRVSYVKKPFAKHSLFCIGLVGAGLLLLALSLCVSIRQEGHGGVNVAAMGFCSLLLNLVGVWYGILSFMEKEKKYILARVGVVAGLIMIVSWLVLIIIGFGG